ncbi:MAG: hypothetical protein R3F48_15630 [Candidatus Zixiibacteriota bacterium]
MNTAPVREIPEGAITRIQHHRDHFVHFKRIQYEENGVWITAGMRLIRIISPVRGSVEQGLFSTACLKGSISDHLITCIMDGFRHTGSFSIV